MEVAKDTPYFFLFFLKFFLLLFLNHAFPLNKKFLLPPFKLYESDNW